jgi:hypothetical protein
MRRDSLVPRIALATVMAIGWIHSGYVSAQSGSLQSLLSTSPQSANAMAYANIPALDKLLKDSNVTTELPSGITEAWLVSEFDLPTFSPRWELGQAVLASDAQPQQYAKSVGGYVDSIEGRDVIWSPKQMYLIPEEGPLVGFARPADRRLVADWLEATPGTSASSYLLEQSKQGSDYLSLMLSWDLENLVSPVVLQQRIGNLQSIAGADPASTAKLLASIRGLTVLVGRRSLDECIVKVSFENSPQSLVAKGPQLLAELLERFGTPAPEVAQWNAKLDGNTVVLQGRITDASLDGLLGIFSLNQQASETQQSLSSNASASSDPIPAASKAYFDKVVKQIERVRDYNARSTGYRARWNDQSARKIDELGTLNVDPELVEYATNVSTALRGSSLVIRQTNIQAGASKAEANAYKAPGPTAGVGYGYYGNYGYGGFGAGYYDPNAAGYYDASGTINSQSRAIGNQSYQAALGNIDAMTLEIRRKMTDKHKLQF